MTQVYDQDVYYGTVTRKTPNSIWVEYKYKNGVVETTKWTKTWRDTWQAKSKPGSIGTTEYRFEFRETA
jgi:hypothetical protein